MRLGFSVGALHQTEIFPMSPEAIAVFRSLGCSVIELSVIRTERLAGLQKMTAADLDGFEYISIHAPALDYVYQKTAESRQLFETLVAAHERINFDAVVIHPDRVRDWSVFSQYDLPWAFENMDDRKDFGRTIEDMQQVFDRVDAKMIFDVQHAYANDQTLQLAARFLAEFADRITHIHLSGYDPVRLHCPLFQSQQASIIESIATKNLPVLIESTLAHVDDVKKEFDYVNKILMQ